MPSPELIAPEEAPPRPTRHQCRARPVAPGGVRPSDVLAVFFAAALVMLLAAAAALIAATLGAPPRLHWLALHLALLGGVSQLVLGAGQFFVCAFLATTPPSRRLLSTQVAVWNLGTVLVAVGVTTQTQQLTDAGGAVLALGLVLFAGSLHAMERRSEQHAGWALRWYQASASCLAAGVLVGVLLAGGVAWTHGSLLGAHLALNLAGWLGTAIVGTLHTFYPSVTGTELRFRRLQAPTWTLWLLGVVALALSSAFSIDALAVAGWLALTAAAALLALNIAASLRARALPLSLPGRLIAVAHGFLLAALTLASVAVILDGNGRVLEAPILPVLAILLLAGWVALTVSGSLLHLLAVLARIRHFTHGLPAPRPSADRATTAICVVAVAAWALAAVPALAGLASAALVLRLVAVAVLAAQIVEVGQRAVRALTRRRTHGGTHAGTHAGTHGHAHHRYGDQVPWVAPTIKEAR